MKRHFRNLLLAGLLVAAAPLVAPMASAQGMPPGPFGPFGPRIERLAAELKLSAEQRAQWDAQVQKSKSLFEAMKKARADMHQTIKAELAKAEPDLAALAAKADEARDKGRSAHRELRDGWLKLYAGFSAEQKAVVKKRILAHIERFDRMRDRMHDRMHDWHHRAPKGLEKDGGEKGAKPPPPPKG
jgi:Spy/CpxP family protein refolding chaperone